MFRLPTFLSQKFYRVGESLHLLLSHAADGRSRASMWKVYASLSKRELYDEQVDLRLKIAGRVFPFRMRIGDVFVLGEILHERQYKLQAQLPSNAVIVDAGSNIGIAALWFLGWYPKATVHAFEPASANFRLLEENLAPLPGVQLFKSAVGRKAENASLQLGEFAGTHSLVSPQAGTDREVVPVVSLAEHMETHRIQKIDLLKLDVEGSELDVLVGLGDRIGDVGVVVGEVHETLVDETEFYDFLEQHGFRICWKRYFRESREEKVHGFEAVRTDRTPPTG